MYQPTNGRTAQRFIGASNIYRGAVVGCPHEKCVSPHARCLEGLGHVCHCRVHNADHGVKMVALLQRKVVQVHILRGCLDGGVGVVKCVVQKERSVAPFGSMSVDEFHSALSKRVAIVVCVISHSRTRPAVGGNSYEQQGLCGG